MQTWLDDAKLTWEAIPESGLIEPKQPVDPEKDHVVGELSHGLRQMYSQVKYSAEEAYHALTALALQEIDQGKNADERHRVGDLAFKAEILEQYFQSCVHDELPASRTYPTLEFRQNFKVVGRDQKDERVDNIRETLAEVGIALRLLKIAGIVNARIILLPNKAGTKPGEEKCLSCQDDTPGP